MIGQPPLDGLDLKASGQAAAIAATDEDWIRQWWAVLGALAATRLPFTSEDITKQIGLPNGEAGPNGNNVVGAMMTAARSRGLIKRTGTYTLAQRTVSHGRVLAQWVGTGRE